MNSSLDHLTVSTKDMNNPVILDVYGFPLIPLSQNEEETSNPLNDVIKQIGTVYSIPDDIVNNQEQMDTGMTIQHITGRTRPCHGGELSIVIESHIDLQSCRQGDMSTTVQIFIQSITVFKNLIKSDLSRKEKRKNLIWRS